MNDTDVAVTGTGKGVGKDRTKELIAGGSTSMIIP